MHLVISAYKKNEINLKILLAVTGYLNLLAILSIIYTMLTSGLVEGHVLYISTLTSLKLTYTPPFDK